MNLKRILEKRNGKAKLGWQKINESFNTKGWKNVDFIYSPEREN